MKKHMHTYFPAPVFGSGNSLLSHFYGSPMPHKLLSGLLSHSNCTLPGCQPSFLCFHSFTPVVILAVHWLDGKTKPQGGDPLRGHGAGCWGRVSLVPFTAQQWLPQDVRAGRPELR